MQGYHDDTRQLDLWTSHAVYHFLETLQIALLQLGQLRTQLIGMVKIWTEDSMIGLRGKAVIYHAAIHEIWSATTTWQATVSPSEWLPSPPPLHSNSAMLMQEAASTTDALRLTSVHFWIELYLLVGPD